MASQSLAITKKFQRKATHQFVEQLYFYMIPTAYKRITWLRKHNKFAMLGEHVHWQPRKYPLDGQRLKIHNNVAIAAGVEFTLHDIIHWIYDGLDGQRDNAVYKGCIEVCDNVFIGAGSRILPNVKIGPNAIVAAGSLVNKDVPPGTVVAGVPAKVVGSFDELMARRKEYTKLVYSIPEEELGSFYWKEFYETRGMEDQRSF